MNNATNDSTGVTITTNNTFVTGNGNAIKI